MARLCTYRNLVFANKNKFSRKITTKNIILISISIVLRLSTPIFAFASGLQNIYIDINLQKATKLALELFILGQKYV